MGNGSEPLRAVPGVDVAGAESRAVGNMIIRQGMVAATIGVGIGVVCAFGLARDRRVSVWGQLESDSGRFGVPLSRTRFVWRGSQYISQTLAA